MRPKPSIDPLRGMQAIVVAFVAYTASGCGLERAGLETISIDASSSSTTASPTGGDAGIASSPITGGGATDDAGVNPDAGAVAVPPPPEAGTPAPPVIDADVPDALVASDASKGDSGESDDSCDLDGDGFKSNSAECGGTDCCDRDARAFPGETNFFAVADACGSFDYDCSGASDPQFAKVSCQLGFLSCSGSGFEGTPPPCGGAATFSTCHLVLACVTSQDQETQGCK